MTETKKRGPGAPRGRRPRSFICVAVKNGQLISNTYRVKDQEPDSVGGSFPQSVAEEQFEKEFEMKPEKVWGPAFLQNKSSKTKKVSKKTQDLSQIELAGPALGKATYNGWKGDFFPLKDTEEVLFVSMEATDPSNKRTPPPAARISKTELTTTQ